MSDRLEKVDVLSRREKDKRRDKMFVNFFNRLFPAIAKRIGRQSLRLIQIRSLLSKLPKKFKGTEKRRLFVDLICLFVKKFNLILRY